MAKKETFFISKTENIEINLYAVRSKDGKWLRSKGQSGYGKSWVDNFSDAKVWNSPRAPKAQITWWATNHPAYGVPDLVQIVSGVCNYLDQSKRVETSQKKKSLDMAKNKVANLEYKINNYIRSNYIRSTKLDKDYVEKLKAELNKAKTELDTLNAK